MAVSLFPPKRDPDYGKRNTANYADRLKRRRKMEFISKPNMRLSPPGPKARKIVAQSKRYISPSYTWAYPLVAERGRGMMIEDIDGNQYLDFVAGVGVCSTGHCHPEIVKVIKAQSERLIHMIGTDFYNRYQVDVAQALTEITPGNVPKQVFLANSGAEAVEAGIKLARYHTRRPKMIAYIGAFHGRTLGALALTASKAVQRRYFAPLLGEVTHIPYPYCYRCLFNLTYPKCNFACISYLKDVLFAKVVPPEEVAAIVFEPIQGEGGYVVPPVGYFKELQKLAREYNILLVCDEVQAGMGRTGKMFAIEHFGIVPDIICLAKGVGSGMPIGAMVAPAKLHSWVSGAHANTFGGNPVACAAALKTIELIKGGLMANARQVGAYMLKRLNALKNKYDIIGDVRGIGLMIGVEFVKSKKTKIKAPEKKAQIVMECFKNGIILMGCGENTIRFSPPLIVKPQEVDIALEIFEKAVRRALKV
jgi:4-aminobutyrate aminotransferase